MWPTAAVHTTKMQLAGHPQTLPSGLSRLALDGTIGEGVAGGALHAEEGHDVPGARLLDVLQLVAVHAHQPRHLGHRQVHIEVRIESNQLNSRGTPIDCGEMFLSAMLCVHTSHGTCSSRNKRSVLAAKHWGVSRSEALTGVPI